MKESQCFLLFLQKFLLLGEPLVELWDVVACGVWRQSRREETSFLPRQEQADCALYLVSVKEKQGLPHHFVSSASLRGKARIHLPSWLLRVVVSCGLTLSHWLCFLLGQLDTCACWCN
ncbi:hypothetical protein E2C01_056093 [Portunus trituberculatus]|uniref:Uncharacterized protein n=1 Tax=Portunus trituberculatus TaxID=210409 RepID=A0A5B7GX96_PORTR|nr:hypothetical protein [Portunus trituberculatus]